MRSKPNMYQRWSNYKYRCYNRILFTLVCILVIMVVTAITACSIQSTPHSQCEIQPIPPTKDYCIEHTWSLRWFNLTGSLCAWKDHE